MKIVNSGKPYSDGECMYTEQELVGRLIEVEIGLKVVREAIVNENKRMKKIKWDHLLKGWG